MPQTFASQALEWPSLDFNCLNRICLRSYSRPAPRGAAPGRPNNQPARETYPNGAETGANDDRRPTETRPGNGPERSEGFSGQDIGEQGLRRREEVYRSEISRRQF